MPFRGGCQSPVRERSVDESHQRQRGYQHPRGILFTNEIKLGLSYRMDIRTTMNLLQVCQLREGVGVAERNVNYAVVDKSRDGAEVGTFLATAQAGSRDEDRCILSGEFAFSPKPTGGIPEGLSNIARRQH